MRKFAIISVALLGMFALYFGNNVLAQRSEINAIKIPIENYFKGQETGKGEFIKKAFHPEGKMMYVRGGKYFSKDFKQYILDMPGKPPKDEDKNKRWIENIEVSGNIAVAKIILDFPHGSAVDYFTLLKTDGEWRITNKVFYYAANSADVGSKNVSEMEAIKIPLNNYLINDKTDDPEYAKKAFHTVGNLQWVSKGKYKSLDFKDFIAGMDGKTNGKESEKGRWIESIDISGNTAVAKIVLDNPKARVYDFFTLLKIDDEWKIVNKAYRWERKQTATKK